MWHNLIIPCDPESLSLNMSGNCQLVIFPFIYLRHWEQMSYSSLGFNTLTHQITGLGTCSL